MAGQQVSGLISAAGQQESGLISADKFCSIPVRVWHCTHVLLRYCYIICWYFQVLCGLPMYVKFAGSVVVALRRWMDAPEINPEDEATKKNYFDNIFVRHKSADGSVDEDLKKFSKMSDEQLAGE